MSTITRKLSNNGGYGQAQAQALILEDERGNKLGLMSSFQYEEDGIIAGITLPKPGHNLTSEDCAAIIEFLQDAINAQEAGE